MEYTYFVFFQKFYYTSTSLDISICNTGRKCRSDPWLQVEGNIPEPLKGCPQYSRSCLYVCLHAGYRALLLTQEPSFWVKWSLGHEKEKYIFFAFRNFHFLRFLLAFFLFVLLHNFKLLVSFSPRNVISELRGWPCIIRN